MRELSEDYGAPRDYDASEPDREPSRLGCMIGAAPCGLSAMVVAALLAWAGYQSFKWATDPKRYVSVSEPVSALWAKKREEA